MLFYINESVAKQAQRGDQTCIKVLAELLEAWKRSKCLIDAKRSTFKALCDVPSLEDYKGPYQRKQGLASIYDYLSFFIQLAAGGDNNAMRIKNAQGRILTIERSQDIFFFSENKIICENSHDYEFYIWGAKQFQNEVVKDYVTLNTSRNNGAGSQISYECQLVNQDKQIGLVVYDSDKKYLGAPIGSTAKAVEDKLLSLNSVYLWSHRLSTHEIENLIPIDILISLKCKHHKTFLAKMANNQSHSMFELLFVYFDFKKGLSPSTLRAYRNNLSSDDFDQFTAFLERLGVRKENINRALRCVWNKKINENVLLGGWGEKLLQQSIEHVESHNLPTISLHPFQRTEWDSIVRDIWSIGCAHFGVIN